MKLENLEPMVYFEQLSPGWTVYTEVPFRDVNGDICGGEMTCYYNLREGLRRCLY